MVRLGDLIPDAARALGLEDELRLSRAIATFEAIVAERVPAAAGACRVLRLEGFTLDVEADAPIVAQELRLRGTELLTAFAAAPGGVGATRSARPRPSRGSPAIIPLTCQPPPEATGPDRSQEHRTADLTRDLVRQSLRVPGPRGSPDHERPGWPYDST